MVKLKQIVPFEHGVSWVVDELMQRASHALLVDGKVWLIDPVDAPEALEAARQLGEIGGVIPLLDRHPRDCQALATHSNVPLHRLPDELPGTPFQVLPVVSGKFWKERALWWPDTSTLVVAELLGNNPSFGATPEHPLGVHAFMRTARPKVGDHLPVSHLLLGHGAPVHDGAAEAIAHAYERRLRDLPKLALLPLQMLRGNRKRG